MTSTAVSNVLANTVLMVPPIGFCFNRQTASDNHFQNDVEETSSALKAMVMAEYTDMTNNLRNAGIDVLEFSVEDTHLDCPDAVFPNNWIMTTTSAQIHCFPMYTQNRQAEVKPQQAVALFEQAGFQVDQVVDFRQSANQQVLEGTGAMILDHNNKRVFAAISQRCDAQLLANYAEYIGFELISFNSQDSCGNPIYHTNVLLSIGADIAVICADVIPDVQQRQAVVDALKQTHQLIEITEQQMTQNFCANVLQLSNQQGESFWVMSESAYKGFTEAQRTILSSSSEIINNAIPTIEKVGGGSCRCMLAEVFLPKTVSPQL